MPYVRMNVRPQGYHWKAHNAYVEFKKEKSEYKFAVSVYKRKGMGSRFLTSQLTCSTQTHSSSSP